MDAVEFGRFREEAEFAYVHLPFIREQWQRAGITPRDIAKPEDLTRVPTTRKEDYRANFPVGVVAAGVSLDDPRIVLLQSSGTEGERLVSAVDRITLAERMAACIEINDGAKRIFESKSNRSCRYAAPNCSAIDCALPDSTIADRILPDATLVLPVLHDLMATPAVMLDKAYEEMLTYRPAYLYADPIHLAQLVARVGRDRIAELKWDNLVVLCSYSYFTRAHRRILRTHFDPEVPVINVMAMSEVGFVGLECAYGRLHLNSSAFLFEFMPGETGSNGSTSEVVELYITTSGDRVSPKIRYATGDLYTRFRDNCPCGHATPGVTSLGRRAQQFQLADNRCVTLATLDEAIGDPQWLLNYQITRSRTGRVLIRCVALQEHEALAFGDIERLRLSLSSLLETPVTVEFVDYLPSSPGGKFTLTKDAWRAPSAW